MGRLSEGFIAGGGSLTLPMKPDPPVTKIVFPVYHAWTGVFFTKSGIDDKFDYQNCMFQLN